MQEAEVKDENETEGDANERVYELGYLLVRLFRLKMCRLSLAI